MAKLLAFASPVWAIRENQQFLLQPSATADTSCASHVKATLANLGEVTDIGQRIGAVLGAQERSEKEGRTLHRLLGNGALRFKGLRFCFWHGLEHLRSALIAWVRST